jgi:oxygen-independent coproporphyrinogen-3 oxidase
MRPETVARYAAPVPRYTSYPTAAQFKPTVGPADFAEALAALEPGQPISLYVHIPFCNELCWYCGCNTKATRQRRPIEAYLATLLAEIVAVAGHCPSRLPVSHIHWGGGSPNSLAAEDIVTLGAALRRYFDVQPEAEFAVEIDPRALSTDQIEAFATAGVNRASIGVQDFDEAVQIAINRIQPFEQTKAVVDGLRRSGIDDINIDLVYGLPHQSRDSVARTIAQTIELRPARVALFGYAHMPDRFVHQKLINPAALPGSEERYGQSRRARRLLEEAGYVPIGLDHFARPDDPLATGELHRNFQGYTTDGASALIGLGASSISRLPAGYFQNAVMREAYARLVEAGGLATARGVVLTEDDRVRAYAIERIMCQFDFPASDLRARFGDDATDVIEIAEAVVEADTDGLVEATNDGFRVTEKGQPFVRSIASCFDAYLETGVGRFSAGV